MSTTAFNLRFRAGFLLVAAAFSLMVLGCRTNQPSYSNAGRFAAAPAEAPAAVTFTNQIDPAWLKPPTQLFTLGPGDKLEIQLMGETSSKQDVIVGPDGKIYFDILPGMDVWGLTLAEARGRIEQAYAQYVREQPQISVTLRQVQSKRVWILGRVQVPGMYPMTAPMTLLEALSQAGGTLNLTALPGAESPGVRQNLADLDRSFVVRDGKCLPVNFGRLLVDGDLTQNIYLQPDDFIYMPAADAQEVFVLGAVTQPRAVPYHPGMTVAGAVAGAYGSLDGAYLSHVAVVRGSLAEPQLTVVDLWAVMHGKEQDLPVKPNDIVYVPLSPYRYLKHYMNVILDTFASSAAINAGERVVGVPTGFSQGVFIPVGSGVQIIPPAAPPPIH